MRNRLPNWHRHLFMEVSERCYCYVIYTHKTGSAVFRCLGSGGGLGSGRGQGPRGFLGSVRAADLMKVAQRFIAG
jgi:hypothetical protein